MPIEERFAMGECARRRVNNEFGIESVLDRWEQLYEACSIARAKGADAFGGT